MENSEYNRLIYNNKFEELANIWNISDLTRYKYINRYLLEYLLARNIHNTRMDNYATKDIIWIKLYLKYRITKPLVKIPLETLLEKDGRETILERLVRVMPNDEKLELYQNMKYSSLWLFRNIEPEIIDIYKRNGINLSKSFISLPRLNDKKITVSKKMKNAINNLKRTYYDTDKLTLNIIIEELKRKSKVDYKRAYMDILKLINYKLDNKDFKLDISKDDYLFGEYRPNDEEIIIDKYTHGLFHHEFSHLLFDEFELSENEEDCKYYVEIISNLNKAKVIKNITNYLNEFHSRVDFMRKIFRELYYKRINKEFGSFEAYTKKIFNDLKSNNLDYIVIDDIETDYYFDDDSIQDAVIEIVTSECRNYVEICITDYYADELYLENLLDALLKGKIWGHDLKVDSLSGHSKSYFRKEKTASFDECLANFDAIKNSKNADKLLNKLREIVGDELVFFLDNYVNEKRNSKIMKLSNKR